MKSNSSPNIIATAIALTVALCLLAATQQPSRFTDLPRVMQVAPEVDNDRSDIADRNDSRPMLNWLLSLRQESTGRSPISFWLTIND